MMKVKVVKWKMFDKQYEIMQKIKMKVPPTSWSRPLSSFAQLDTKNELMVSTEFNKE